MAKTTVDKKPVLLSSLSVAIDNKPVQSLFFFVCVLCSHTMAE